MKLEVSELLKIIKELKVDNTEELLEKIRNMSAEMDVRLTELKYLSDFRDRALAKGYVEEDYNLGDK